MENSVYDEFEKLCKVDRESENSDKIERILLEICLDIKLLKHRWENV